MTRPFCPKTNELCVHHVDHECFRRWARPVPAEVGTAACPGFCRDRMKANIIHTAELISGRRSLSLDEATRELDMAGRLDEIMGVA